MTEVAHRRKFVPVIQNGGVQALIVNVDEVLDVQFKNGSSGPAYLLTYKNGQTRTIYTTSPDDTKLLMEALNG